MPTKIKVFFTMLAVLAVVSVFSFLDIFTGVKAIFAPEPEPLPVLEADADKDGLSDNEESYWDTDFQNPDTDGDGFMDGEEVISEHDPTIPGPNDAFADTNITQKVANLALGGLYDGALKADDPNFDKSVESLTLSVMDDGVSSFIPKIDPSKIKVVSSTKEIEDIYVQQVEPIWEKFFTALYEEANSIASKLELINNGGMANPKFVEYFTTQREIFNSLANEVLQIPVPEDWLNKHTNFISYILQFSEVNDSLAQGKDDPVRAAMGFNLFVSLVEDFPNISKSFIKN